MRRPTGRGIFCSYPHYFSDNGPHSDYRGPHRLHQTEQKAHLAALLLMAIALGGCDATVAPGTESESPAASLLPDSTLSNNACGEGGALKTTLYGALAGDIEWLATEMQCEGMPRPGGAGARLRFAGLVGDEDMSIAFIIAMPDLKRGMDGLEFASNVTVIEESSSRFFSTADLESCWTDIESNAALDETGDRFVIGGVLYCISPLPEVNGAASISIPEMRFSGLIDWTAT